MQPPAHIIESYLLGVVSDPAKHQVVMTFRTPDHHEFTFHAHGVEHLLVNDFVEQNIVYEVRIHDAAGESHIVKQLLATLLFDCDAADVTDTVRYAKLEGRVNAVGEGRQVLVELEPVYGASVLMLANNIEWVDA